MNVLAQYTTAAVGFFKGYPSYFPGINSSQSRNFWKNLVKISPKAFISHPVFLLLLVKGSNATLLKTHSGDLITCSPLTNQKISSECFGAMGMQMLPSVSIDFDKIHTFHWLIYNLIRSCQEVLRTCLERGCVRSFHKRQKQTKSEMKELILIRLFLENIISYAAFRFAYIIF